MGANSGNYNQIMIKSYNWLAWKPFRIYIIPLNDGTVDKGEMGFYPTTIIAKDTVNAWYNK